MTAARGPLLPAEPGSHRSALLAGAVILVVALTAAIATGSWAVPTIAVLATAAVVGVILCRLDVAVAVLAGGFFFNNYLAHGAGLVTVDKVIGALAVMAWALEWAVNRRPVLTTRGLWLLCAFLLWIGVSIGGARSEKAALVTSLRYVIFATLYFLVLQAVRGDRRRADILVRVMVAAAAVASVVGLAGFFGHHVTRASGPLKDPNDFGFILASSVPLVVYQVRWAATRWGKAICGLALVSILVCTLATFSRSALTGLALATLWALATRRIRLRWLIGVAAGLAAVAGGTFVVAPQVIHTALGQKAHVAGENVDVRFAYYRVEVTEWSHYPITGVGPGNFVHRFYQFAPEAKVSLPYPSNVLTISGEEAYLVILAEQGAVGLALFLGYLAVSWADLRRRFPGDQRRDQLQAATAFGFIVACIGALFLAEQYYPPLWFLPALGASLAGGWPEAGVADSGLSSTAAPRGARASDGAAVMQNSGNHQ